MVVERQRCQYCMPRHRCCTIRRRHKDHGLWRRRPLEQKVSTRSLETAYHPDRTGQDVENLATHFHVFECILVQLRALLERHPPCFPWYEKSGLDSFLIKVCWGLAGQPSQQVVCRSSGSQINGEVGCGANYMVCGTSSGFCGT